MGSRRVDHGRLDPRTEGLIVVDVGSLCEATKDPLSLVPFQRAIRFKLVLEDTFADDDVGANGARDKIPGVVGDQDNKFFFYGAAPVWNYEGGTDGGGHRRQGRRRSGH
jgi:hypothetical protein